MTDPSVDLVEGDRVELEVGAPAHGGHCVARLDNRVLFVRHALPGERVVAEITERHRSYLRADAVEILEASPDRVPPPCPYAHPGACGGCDLQHASGDAQLRWKGAVVREQLSRLAGLGDFPVRVEALPGGLLGWRSRVRYAVDAAGRAGLLQHRSHEVVPIDRCLIAHPAIQGLDVLERPWLEDDAIEAVASTGGEVVAFSPDDNVNAPVAAGRTLAGPAEVVERAVGRRWSLSPETFWQIHPAAAETLAGAVLDLLDPAAGEVSWDLYGGAGLFAAAVTARTGARTTLVESSPLGCAAARANLTDLPTIEVVEARVETALHRRRVTGPVDLVVLDPPRSGAGARVVRGIAAARPRAVAYVACDPAALARDIATFRAEGWKLAALRAFDCFPMTQHVECVALLEP